MFNSSFLKVLELWDDILFEYSYQVRQSAGRHIDQLFEKSECSIENHEPVIVYSRNQVTEKAERDCLM